MYIYFSPVKGATHMHTTDTLSHSHSFFYTAWTCPCPPRSAHIAVRRRSVQAAALCSGYLTMRPLGLPRYPRTAPSGPWATLLQSCHHLSLRPGLVSTGKPPAASIAYCLKLSANDITRACEASSRNNHTQSFFFLELAYHRDTQRRRASCAPSPH